MAQRNRARVKLLGQTTDAPGARCRGPRPDVVRPPCPFGEARDPGRQRPSRCRWASALHCSMPRKWQRVGRLLVATPDAHQGQAGPGRRKQGFAERDRRVRSPSSTASSSTCLFLPIIRQIYERLDGFRPPRTASKAPTIGPMGRILGLLRRLRGRLTSRPVCTARAVSSAKAARHARHPKPSTPTLLATLRQNSFSATPKAARQP